MFLLLPSKDGIKWFFFWFFGFLLWRKKSLEDVSKIRKAFAILAETSMSSHINSSTKPQEQHLSIFHL